MSYRNRCAAKILVAGWVVLAGAGCVSVQQKSYHLSVPLVINESCPDGCLDIAELQSSSEPELHRALQEWLALNPPEAENMRTWLHVTYEIRDTTDARKPFGEQDTREFKLMSVSRTPRLKYWQALPIESTVHGRVIPTDVFTLVSNLAYTVAPAEGERPLTRDVLRIGIGEVTLGYQLDAGGRPTAVEVLDNYSGERALETYARRLLDNWRFEPEHINGAPLLDTRYTIRFCIRNGRAEERTCSSRPLKLPGHAPQDFPIRPPMYRTMPRDGIQ